ncbi:hypothetical protein GOBAR_DD25023 [Gossypium barbadense]|nr:hypothetical protein GOBAR_DD25023 [Gossypium barbadense]
MQTLLLPATRSGICAVAAGPLRPPLTLSPPNFLTSIKTRKPKPPLSPFASYDPLNVLRSTLFSPKVSSSSVSPSFTSSNDDTDKAKLAQVSKRLENTSRYFKRLGNLGFWGQLVCTLVSAVILSFSVVITGKITSPATFYATASGIVAAFISVFWSFGYIRLSEKLKRTANDPSKVEVLLGVIRDIECTRIGMKMKIEPLIACTAFVVGRLYSLAPPRADVVKSLKNGIVLNLLGMGAAILGMQATVGLLVAKALTSSTNPYYQGISPGYSPVLALDVFLVQAVVLYAPPSSRKKENDPETVIRVRLLFLYTIPDKRETYNEKESWLLHILMNLVLMQASGNTILSHFLGLVFSLELLRSVTLPQSDGIPIPKVA